MVTCCFFLTTCYLLLENPVDMEKLITSLGPKLFGTWTSAQWVRMKMKHIMVLQFWMVNSMIFHAFYEYVWIISWVFLVSLTNLKPPGPLVVVLKPAMNGKHRLLCTGTLDGHIHTYMHACMHACIHIYIYIYVFTRCVYIYVCVCVWLWVHVFPNTARRDPTEKPRNPWSIASRVHHSDLKPICLERTFDHETTLGPKSVCGIYIVTL